MQFTTSSLLALLPLAAAGVLPRQSTVTGQVNAYDSTGTARACLERVGSTASLQSQNCVSYTFTPVTGGYLMQSPFSFCGFQTTSSDQVFTCTLDQNAATIFNIATDGTISYGSPAVSLYYTDAFPGNPGARGSLLKTKRVATWQDVTLKVLR